MYQLELASQAGTSPRYVSSLEKARSRPGRNLVLRLAAALDVPLRERNAMLTSAGLSPAFATRQLTDAPMLLVRIVLDRILRRHGPDPAWVVVENWLDVTRAGVVSLPREASRPLDVHLFELLRRAETHLRTVPDTQDRTPTDSPLVCARLRSDGQTIHTISTVMQFDSAAEVTASELRVELLFPADDESVCA